MPKGIHEAAYDGELATVTRLLAQNPQLLDQPFTEGCPEVMIPLAHVAFGIKKIVSAGFGFFALGCAAFITAETAGAGVVLIFTSAGASKGIWHAFDKDIKYYMTNINRWAPLDCAVFGYINGNESAFGVAEYLMQQGANGAVAPTQPNKRLFETFGNSQIEVLWRREQASRVQRLQNNQLTQAAVVQHTPIENQYREVAVQLTNLQQRVNAENANRVALQGALAAKEQEYAALATRLDNINMRLGQLRLLRQTSEYTLFMLPHGAANPGAAAQQVVPKI